MNTKTVCLILGVAAFTAADFVEAFEIKQGKWRVTMAMQNPMAPQPQVTTSEECVDEENFNPAREMSKGGECEVLDIVEDSNSYSWKVRCGSGGAGAVMEGEGFFETAGNSANGEMTMSMSFSGQNMVIRNSWQGEFLGPCD